MAVLLRVQIVRGEFSTEREGQEIVFQANDIMNGCHDDSCEAMKKIVRDGLGFDQRLDFVQPGLPGSQKGQERLERLRPIEFDLVKDNRHHAFGAALEQLLLVQRNRARDVLVIGARAAQLPCRLAPRFTQTIRNDRRP
jgi:hypothetical protein